MNPPIIVNSPEKGKDSLTYSAVFFVVLLRLLLGFGFCISSATTGFTSGSESGAGLGSSMTGAGVGLSATGAGCVFSICVALSSASLLNKILFFLFLIVSPREINSFK